MNSHQRRLERRFADRFARSPKGAAIIKAIDEFINHCKNTRQEMVRYYTPKPPIERDDLYLETVYGVDGRPIAVVKARR